MIMGRSQTCFASDHPTDHLFGQQSKREGSVFPDFPSQMD